MTRTLPEWLAKTPDTAIPMRVRLRVFERAGGRCEGCGRKITAGDTWDCDHKQALINGGENRENNLQVLCNWCHGDKTAGDVAEKSTIYRKRTKSVGAKPKKTKSRWVRKLDGTTVLRDDDIGKMR